MNELRNDSNDSTTSVGSETRLSHSVPPVLPSPCASVWSTVTLFNLHSHLSTKHTHFARTTYPEEPEQQLSAIQKLRTGHPTSLFLHEHHGQEGAGGT